MNVWITILAVLWVLIGEWSWRWAVRRIGGPPTPGPDWCLDLIGKPG